METAVMAKSLIYQVAFGVLPLSATKCHQLPAKSLILLVALVAFLVARHQSVFGGVGGVSL